MKIDLLKLDQEKIAQDAERWKDSIGNLQIVVYVMCGGGMIGRSAAEQPANFYIDTRVSARPYPTKAIYQAVETLVTLAKANGLDPYNMPPMPDFHSCGVF